MCYRGVSRLRNSGRRLSAPAFVSVLFLLATWSANAQSAFPAPPAASDLARKNMAHVAASVSQVEPVLRNNPGILLELKNWVAREAANQGRLLSDADLTDLVIFDRLRSDTEFRAVATRLLQRYG